MMRGHKLHRKLLLFDMPEVPEVPTEQRGRSAELIEKRNDRMLHRYVFYVRKFPLHRLEAHAKQLSEEFDLSETRVSELILEHQGEAMRIRQDWPGEAALRKRWPWMVWQS